MFLYYLFVSLSVIGSGIVVYIAWQLCRVWELGKLDDMCSQYLEELYELKDFN